MGNMIPGGTTRSTTGDHVEMFLAFDVRGPCGERGGTFCGSALCGVYKGCM